MSIPLVGAWYASSRGRSFWTWYFIGLFLPVISFVILLCMPDIHNPIEKELQSIRIKNKMLGLKSEVPGNLSKFLNLLNKTVNKICFEIAIQHQNKEKSIFPIIDNIPLHELITKIDSKRKIFHRIQKSNVTFQGLPPELALPPSEYLLGKPNPLMAKSHKNRTVLFFDQTIQQQISFNIVVLRKYVVWHQFEKWQDGKLLKTYPKVGPFLFDRWHYELELNDVSYRYKKMV